MGASPNGDYDGDKDRAMGALARAVDCAERGRSNRPVVQTTGQDLKHLGPAGVRGALDRILMAPHPDLGLDCLLATGVLDALMPEVKALVGLRDVEWRHKDVWKHTRQVLRQSVPRLAVRWSALLHDIGKVRTRSIDRNGQVHFIGHAEVGARMFDRMTRRDRLFSRDRSLRSQIRFLIRHHLRAGQYDGSWTDSAVRRFAREVGAHLQDLLYLSRADITSERAHKRARGLALIDELQARVTQLAAEDAIVPPLPSGLGNEIMSAFGLEPSRLIGEVKRTLEAAVTAGELEPHRDGAYYVQFIRDHRERFGL